MLMPASRAALRTRSSQTPQGGRSRVGVPPISAAVRASSSLSVSGGMASKQSWL